MTAWACKAGGERNHFCPRPQAFNALLSYAILAYTSEANFKKLNFASRTSFSSW